MIRRIVSYGLAEASARAVNWLFMLALPTVVSKDEYGLISLLLGLEIVLANILTLGQDRAVLRLFKPGATDNVSGTAYLLVLLVCGSTCALAVAGGFWVRDIRGLDVHWMLAPLLAGVTLICLNRVYLAELRVWDAPGAYLRQRLGFVVGRVVAFGAFVPIVGGAYAYIYGNFIGAFAVCLPLLGRKKFLNFDRSQLAAWAAFGSPFVLHLLSGSLMSVSDRFVIDAYMSLASVAEYTFSYMLGSGVVFLYGALAVFFEPYIYRSESDAAERERRLSLYTALASCLGCVYCVALLLVLSIETPFLLKMANSEVVMVVGGAHLLHPLYLSGNYRLACIKESGRLAINSAVCALGNLALSIWLVPRIGLLGAAYSTLVWYFVQAVAITALSRARAGVHTDRLEGIFGFGIAMGVAVSSTLGQSYFLPMVGVVLAHNVYMLFCSVRSRSSGD